MCLHQYSSAIAVACQLFIAEGLLKAVKLLCLLLQPRTRPIVNVSSNLTIVLRGNAEMLNFDDLQCGENAWCVSVLTYPCSHAVGRASSAL